MVKKYILTFMLGFFSFALIYFLFFGYISMTGFSVFEYDSPANRIHLDDITVFEDKIIIKINNSTISSYENTGSMIPFIDENSNGIRIVPESSEDIEVGDIISYRTDFGLVVHRVVRKGLDSNGVYFICKGDSEFFKDRKIRFEDIEYVTIGIIY